MAWFLRVTEQPDGCWVCRFGREDLGSHPSLAVALHHLVEVAYLLGGRENFSFHVHHLDGRVDHLRGIDPVPGETDAET